LHGELPGGGSLFFHINLFKMTAKEKRLQEILDEVMEMLFLDVEKNNNSDKVFDKENYRRLYREYLNIKNDTERKPEDNIQQGI